MWLQVLNWVTNIADKKKRRFAQHHHHLRKPTRTAEHASRGIAQRCELLLFDHTNICQISIYPPSRNVRNSYEYNTLHCLNLQILQFHTALNLSFKANLQRKNKPWHKHLHAGMRFLLGKVTGEAEVWDTNMAVFIQQDISWLWSKEEDWEGDADYGQVGRDNIISAGNIVGVPTYSRLKIQFPLARRNFWVAAENQRKLPVLVIL